MSSRLRYFLLALGVGLFGYLVHQVGIAAIIQNVQALGYWFAAILAVWAVGYLLNTLSYSLVLGEEAAALMGTRRILGMVLAGFAMNYATPFLHMGGEPFRMAILKERIGGARAAFATIAYKAINALSSVCYWTIGATFVVASGHLRPLAAVLVLGPPLTVLVSAVLFVRWHSGNVFASLRSTASHFRLLAPLERLLARHAEALGEADRHFRELRDTRLGAILAVLAIETTVRVGMALELFIILWAIGRHMSFWTVIGMDAGANFILTAGFFMPFELGAREGGLYFILKSFGVPAGLGVFVALVNRIRELFWIAVGLIWGHFLTGKQRADAPVPEVVPAVE